jgi:DNA topoisomerase-2
MTEKFEVLTDREHCLHRPGVYIGSVTPEPQSAFFNYDVKTLQLSPGLLKIIYEILDNSVDEYIRTGGKFANKISVDIGTTLNGSNITISDNGRGIPQEILNGKPRPVWAWTELRAGSNFDDSKRVGAGTNGMGASLTNIFSREFIGTTCDGKNTLTVTCGNNMQEIDWKTRKGGTQGTSVEFLPDYERFQLADIDQFHIEAIEDRLNNLAISFRGIQFTFNGTPIRFKTTKDISSQFANSIIVHEDENALMLFAPMGKRDYHVLSCVNGLKVTNGGSHVDYVMHRVVEAIRTVVKKKHKIEVPPSQIRPHLLFASWITGFPALKFDSQTKERVTNTIAEVSAFFKDIDFEKVAKKIINSPEIIDPIVQAIIDRRDLEEARELAKKQKTKRAERVVNHIAATDENPENKTIFLAEGLSALANFIATRNSKTMGAFPLKGKPLNVNGRRPIEIFKNEELSNIMKIIGLELGVEAVNLKYGKIAIFSDRDLDGHAVYCLLLNFFALWPELFKQKRIYRVMTPLFYCTKGKQVKIFYSVGDYTKEDLTGWKVDRYKGLGSMPEEVYSKCINEPVLECVSDFDGETLEMAFGPDADARKTWMME